MKTRILFAVIAIVFVALVAHNIGTTQGYETGYDAGEEHLRCGAVMYFKTVHLNATSSLVSANKAMPAALLEDLLDYNQYAAEKDCPAQQYEDYFND